MSRADVVVAGGGVIGLGVAWRLAQSGLSVSVLDPAPGSGATGAAAGMLAPVTEAHVTERALVELNLAAAARYPSFVEELTDATGHDVGYRTCGTVAVAWDGADLRALHDLYDVQREWGLDVERLTGAILRSLEPNLAPGLPGGVLANGDHQVDPVALHTALLAAARQSGVDVVHERVDAVVVADGRVRGVRTSDGAERAAGTVVVACGAWSRIAGIPVEDLPPVRPVKGQTLHLSGEPGLLMRIVRGAVRGNPVYIVPRDDGRIVVGASSEEAGFDLRPRAGAVYELLRDAQTLVPVLAELELVEVRTGLRPGSPDNAPLVGPGSVPGLVLATGHYRNGVLLAPVTADAVASLLTDGRLPGPWESFTPRRFASDDRLHTCT